MKKAATYALIPVFLAVTSFTRTETRTLSPAVPFNDHFLMTIDDDSWNDCTGEWVHFTGTVHFLVHGTINNNRISMIQQGNYQGVTGIGQSSGKIYTGSSNFTDVNNGNFSGSYTAITNASVKLRTAGQQNNLVYVTRIKTTVNARGEVTVSRLEESNYCQ